MEINKIFNIDCLDGMKQLPDKCVDLILIDPPYNIQYKSNFGSQEYKDKIQHTEWDKSFDIRGVYQELWRILKNNSDMYIFGRWENYEIMKELEGFKQILIWHKINAGGLGNLTCFIPTYELIFYFKKGSRIPNKRTSAVIDSIPIQNFSCKESKPTGKDYGQQFMKHPTQKPLDLIKKLLKISSNQNDLVLDSFMGSGTTAVACKQLNRNFIGYEISKEYCDIANKRLKDIPECMIGLVTI